MKEMIKNILFEYEVLHLN